MRIAALARIRLEDDEAKRLAEDFGKILAYVDRLRTRDEADEAEPLVHAVPSANPVAKLRSDVPMPEGPASPLDWETVDALAPVHNKRHLQVPRVLEEGR